MKEMLARHDKKQQVCEEESEGEIWEETEEEVEIGEGE